MFFSKPPSYLGIDLGMGGPKIVELRNNKGRAQLLTYGFAEEICETSTENYFANTDRIATIIKKICDKASATSKQVVASLPTHMVFDSVITLPAMPAKELKSSIEAEAQKLIARPLDEMVLYWNIINQNDNETESIDGKISDDKDIIASKKTKYLKILLTAAPKKMINKYIEIFHKAGLKLLSLETAAFALTRSLVGMDKLQILIADIGAQTTEIIILNNGLPVFSRGIDLGSAKITAVLAEKLKIDIEEAEQLKFDFNNNISNQSAEIINILEKNLTPITNEIKYSINLYFNRLSLDQGIGAGAEQLLDQKIIEKIILTGGGSLLGGLNDFIKKELQIRSFIGNPWARIIYPQDLKPLLDEIGPKFSIAAGLAMREIN